MPYSPVSAPRDVDARSWLRRRSRILHRGFALEVENAVCARKTRDLTEHKKHYRTLGIERDILGFAGVLHYCSGGLSHRHAINRRSDQQDPKQLSEGGKIDACKLHQNFTGSSLLEAKQFVESLSSVEPGESDIAEDCDEALVGQILDLLESGCKLDAVRLYRDRTGRSLMESKNFIEKLISEFEILEKSKSQSGCVGIILIFVVLGFILQSML